MPTAVLDAEIRRLRLLKVLRLDPEAQWESGGVALRRARSCEALSALAGATTAPIPTGFASDRIVDPRKALAGTPLSIEVMSERGS